MERQLRNKVEIEVQRGMDKKQEEKLKMNESKQVALKLYQDLCERLNMKCPRCELVFDDYTGCNALTCRGQSCRAAFCAICLKDCDTNAHHHVRTCHGDLFDKKAFNTARKKREIDTINDFSAEISGEPHEVKELVRIEFEKSQSDQTQYCEGGFPFAPFLSRAKRDLLAAVNSGRLSILSDAEAYPVETGLTRRDISPRNVIPENYRLRLLPSMENIYSIILEEQVHTINGIAWKKIALQDEKEIRSKDLDRPTVDALKNIAMALSCGVVAFLGTSSLYQSCISRKEGKYDRDEAKDPTICVQFHKICRNGNMEENGQSLSEERDVIGVDQNVRMLILADHVLKSSNESMSFEPLQHFVTGRQPSRVFTSISMPPPPSFLTLNNKQQKVAHPLSLLTAMEVAGPPGTGKTKTIMELVRGILHCTDYDVILMSERNGAIDAIAEKMAGDCLTLNQSQSVKSVSNVELWSKVLSFGSFGGMGPFSALFTSTAKELYHPEVLEADRVLKKKIKFMENYSRRLREAFSRSIYDLEGELFEESKPSMRGRLIQNNKESNLENARDIISSTINALGAVKQFRADSPGKQNPDLVILPLEHSAILRDLIPINCEKADHHSVPKSITSNPKAINRALEAIERRLQEVLQNKLFNVAACEAMDYSIRLSQSSLQDVRLRIKIDLQKDARVFLSTIGSSHKINKSVLEAHRVEPEIVSLDEDALNEMQRMNEQTKPTIVIFDEAGCIPSYELLGLSRLGRSIKSIICVGDKHQLPPYNPGSTKNDFKKGGSFGNVRRGKPVRQPEKVQTLLDASGLRSEKVKVEHTEQYRVPRDIAGVLNARIYRGNYQTSVHCNAPIKGFRLVNVPKSGRDQPYVNHNEIDACIQLVESSLQAGLKHTMVLTPYKKQQREMEFRFKKKGWNDILSVLTIDQCQGQEADIVILSLVRKPTRFLDKNRLNVALSRACQKMYFLCDKNLFVEASQNQAWECHLLAKDLLDLAGN